MQRNDVCVTYSKDCSWLKNINVQIAIATNDCFIIAGILNALKKGIETDYINPGSRIDAHLKG